ncbi:MAG: SAM-dependent chlorinase/fluorinase [Geminocystis sp.]|nr:SAM-dependent chlorinase/fluorinase [Geminocystis sp.]HIK37852.1 SAM-dependent chlorinase/fluorinase [Geminocystis sp. M7585_C2015_104]MCS7146952.1 SAM-dependent chlorinase/fluorinase [Geminocystis sp.]MCX8077264.1 SAM-dependent chlorinase/fluorinase [Geminocystis sp.]MDW8115776.1 SAM-dependent chlorinase/fluorinase [Geminocystis sp.]
MIVLLTDFGLQDVYVGVMKGVIYSINPSVTLVDLTHGIPRQNIFAASFALQESVPFFPDNTIYLAVVDPGVGSERKPLAISFDRGILVGPNNGIFTGVINNYKIKEIRELTNCKYWLIPNPSNTFHGRDIFAPVAAYISKGIPLQQLGNQLEERELIRLPLPPLQVKSTEIIGAIQYIDIYGNLITNIPAKLLENKNWCVVDKEITIPHRLTYSSVGVNQLVALIGSHGYLEIAVNQGSAKMFLNKEYGDTITVKIYS